MAGGMDHMDGSGSWNGFYIGAQGGWGNGNSDAKLSTTTTASVDSDGALGGGFIGYNLQMAQFVVGIEGDYNWTNADGNANCQVAPGVFGTCHSEMDSVGSVRGRIGWDAQSLLIYATGGGAWAKVKGSFNTTFLGVTFGDSASDTIGGWVYGGGVEWRVHDHLNLRAEVLRYNFDSHTFNFSSAATTANASIDATVFLVGASWMVN